MICFAEPVLTEGLYIVLYVRYVHLTTAKRSLFLRDKHILSSEGLLHNDYVCKGSVAKKKKKELWS
jgi:hypothetical protein